MPLLIFAPGGVLTLFKIQLWPKLALPEVGDVTKYRQQAIFGQVMIHTVNCADRPIIAGKLSASAQSDSDVDLYPTPCALFCRQKVANSIVSLSEANHRSTKAASGVTQGTFMPEVAVEVKLIATRRCGIFILHDAGLPSQPRTPDSECLLDLAKLYTAQGAGK